MAPLIRRDEAEHSTSPESIFQWLSDFLPSPRSPRCHCVVKGVGGWTFVNYRPLVHPALRMEMVDLCDVPHYKLSNRRSAAIQRVIFLSISRFKSKIKKNLIYYGCEIK